MNCHKFGHHFVLVLGLFVWAFVMLTTNSCLAEDPSSYWKLEEDSQPYTDSANGNDASCVDGNLAFCPERVKGAINQAQLFDRKSQQGLDVPGSFYNWVSNDSFTIAFWMNRPDPPPPAGISNNEVIVGREDRPLASVKGLHWWVGVKNEDGKARFVLVDSKGFGYNEALYLASKNTVADGEWHHVVAVRDGVQNKNFLYVDGVLEDERTITYPNNFASVTADLNIGYLAGNFDKGYYYSGAVDDVQIYDSALSDSEIADLYRLKAGRNMPWLPILLDDE